MKKLISLILALALLAPAAAYACETLTQTGTYTGYARVAMHAESRELFCKTALTERVKVYPAQSVEGPVRGITARGVIRVQGEMRYFCMGGTAIGMSKVGVTVRIDAEYLDAVAQIVAREMGEQAEVTAGNVIACTLVRTESTVYHKALNTWMDKILIGDAIFDGTLEGTGLYLSDWNGDGLPDICFAVYPGNGKAHERQEPSQDHGNTDGPNSQTNVNVNVNVNASVGVNVNAAMKVFSDSKPGGKGCGGAKTTNTANVIQVNIGVIGNPTQQVNVGSGNTNNGKNGADCGK